MTVGVIFKERPEQWGLRGDPYLWDDLEKRFNRINLPFAVEKFEEEIYFYIKQCTGQRLEEAENTYIEMYDRGGLTSGMISYAFWSNIAIPLLIKRLEAENKRIDRVNNT